MNLKVLSLVVAVVLVMASGVYYKKQSTPEQISLPAPSGVQVPAPVNPVLPSVSSGGADGQVQLPKQAGSTAGGVATHDLGQFAPPRGEPAAVQLQTQAQETPITPLPTFPVPGAGGASELPTLAAPPGGGAYPVPTVVPPPVPAPSGTGRVFGQVLINDPYGSGQVVLGVGQTVSLGVAGTTQTDAAGRFMFDNVSPGYYPLTVNGGFIRMSSPPEGNGQILALPGVNTFIIVNPQQEHYHFVPLTVFFQKIGGFQQAPGHDFKAVLHIYQDETEPGHPPYNQTLGASSGFINVAILGRPGPTPIDEAHFLLYLPSDKLYWWNFTVVERGGDDPCVWAAAGDSHPDQEGNISFMVREYPKYDNHVEVTVEDYPDGKVRLCTGYWQEIARNWQ